MKYLVAALGCILLLYLALLGGIFLLMLQPTIVVAKGMARIQHPVLFWIFPFKQLWFLARQGSLRLGDEAPDFRLQTPDQKGTVTLSSFRGQKPVVLVFGSYT